VCDNSSFKNLLFAWCFSVVYKKGLLMLLLLLLLEIFINSFKLEYTWGDPNIPRIVKKFIYSICTKLKF